MAPRGAVNILRFDPHRPYKRFPGSAVVGKPEGALRAPLRGPQTTCAGITLADHLAVCLPKCVGIALRVDIHGCANIRVPQEFLLDFQIDSKRVKQRGMAVLSAVYNGENGVGTVKELARSYLAVTQDLTWVMNHLKALYRSWAIPCTGQRVYASRYRCEWLAQITEAGVRRRTVPGVLRRLSCPREEPSDGAPHAGPQSISLDIPIYRTRLPDNSALAGTSRNFVRPYLIFFDLTSLMLEHPMPSSKRTCSAHLHFGAGLTRTMEENAGLKPLAST
jgi:hypothetical protein